MQSGERQNDQVHHVFHKGDYYRQGACYVKTALGDLNLAYVYNNEGKVTYNYTPRGNSGKITSSYDAISGEQVVYQYDALNRLISTGYTYDVENRISFANAGGVQYFYDGQNKRVWQATCTGPCGQGGYSWVLSSDAVNLFGADGKQLEKCSPLPAWNNQSTGQVSISFGCSSRVYFGGKLVAQSGNNGQLQPTVQDRLGSVGKYYLMERSATRRRCPTTK